MAALESVIFIALRNEAEFAQSKSVANVKLRDGL